MIRDAQWDLAVNNRVPSVFSVDSGVNSWGPSLCRRLPDDLSDSWCSARLGSKNMNLSVFSVGSGVNP